MRAHRYKYLAAFLFSLAVMISFQNCGNGLETAEEDITTDLGSSASLKKEFGNKASFVESVPFAFEASLDTIVYNSCLGGGTKPGFYNLKAAAVSHPKAGLKINGNIVNALREKFAADAAAAKANDPSFNESILWKRALYHSPANKGSVLSLSFREEGALSGAPVKVVNRTSGSVPEPPVVGKDLVKIFGDVTDDRILSSLVRSSNSPMYANPLPIPDANFIFEGSFVLHGNGNYDTAGGLAEGFRLATTSAGSGSSNESVRDLRLNLAFGGSAQNILIPKAAEDSAPQGRAYKLEFDKSSIPGNFHTTWRNYANILDSVEESPSTGTEWDCNNAFYSIVREADRATYCPHWIPKTPNDFAELAQLRRHLPTDLWDINLAYRCVVSKGFTYYPGQEPTYNPQEKCFYVGSGSTGGEKPCVEYISFCRKNP